VLGQGPLRQFGNSIAPLSSAADSDGVRGNEAKAREFQEIFSGDGQELGCDLRIDEMFFMICHTTLPLSRYIRTTRFVSDCETHQKSNVVARNYLRQKSRGKM
jgi:hypothetical protein